VVARLHAAPEGFIRGLPTREGTPAVIAFARAPLSRYHAVLTVPEASFEAPLRAELRRALIGSALAVAVGLGLALVLARTVLRAFGRVAAAAGGRGAGAGRHRPEGGRPAVARPGPGGRGAAAGR
jgi:hypothetical protein